MEGLGIIFHSGSYDRVHHGLSLALAAGALGGPVKLFFTYWALESLRKEGPPALRLDKEALARKALIVRNMKRGHLRGVSGLLADAKALGINVYVCTASMGILNIARNELAAEVDKSMGITGFLAEVSGYQMLFI